MMYVDAPSTVRIGDVDDATALVMYLAEHDGYRVVYDRLQREEFNVIINDNDIFWLEHRPINRIHKTTERDVKKMLKDYYGCPIRYLYDIPMEMR